MPDFIDDTKHIAGADSGASEGDPIASDAEIEDYIGGLYDSIGTFHDHDDTAIPASATERQNGDFLSYSDLVQYLDEGGLVMYDEFGMPTPNPIVHILAYDDPITGDTRYIVYIDDDTG